MPKHTKTQPSPGTSIPGASKAWMSHFSPSSNGRIVRVRLHDTNYLAYAPELLCRLTEWHNLHGGACLHGNADPVYSRWPCASCGYHSRPESKRALRAALEKESRKIALVPWPKPPFGAKAKDLEMQGTGVRMENWYAPVAAQEGYEKRRMGRQYQPGEERFSHELLEGAMKAIEEREEKKREKKKEKMAEGAQKKKKGHQGKDVGRLKFAHAHLMPGRDDPVEDGRNLAREEDVFLPSDGVWRGENGSGVGAGVRLGTEEEKELADLRRLGVLRDGDAGEGVLTLDSIVRDDEPVYRVRLVKRRKRKGGKGKGRAEVVQTPVGLSEEQGGNASCDVVAGGEKAARAADQTLEFLPQEVIDAMPDHCWAGFFADLEAEGWVPVVEDDLLSVAESWIVMESESEDSDWGA